MAAGPTRNDHWLGKRLPNGRYVKFGTAALQMLDLPHMTWLWVDCRRRWRVLGLSLSTTFAGRSEARMLEMRFGGKIEDHVTVTRFQAVIAVQALEDYYGWLYEYFDLLRIEGPRYRSQELKDRISRAMELVKSLKEQASALLGMRERGTF
jgi:hypothetical protein